MLKYFKAYSPFPVVCAALLLLSGCANALPVADDKELPKDVVELIAKRYSYAPEVQNAAEGFAKASVVKWRSFARSNTYTDELAVRAASAQVCLSGRAEASGRAMTFDDLKDFLDALASTSELSAAYRKSSHVQSGNPLSVYADKDRACAIAKVD